MDDYRSASLGRYYDLQVRFTKTSTGGTIEVGWYKKDSNSQSYNNLDASGYVQINDSTVYNPTRIAFDMRNNSIGDFVAFYTQDVTGKSVHVVAYFDANMSSGLVTSGTVDWTIELDTGGAVYIATPNGNGTYTWRKYRLYVDFGGRWHKCKVYVDRANYWRPTK